MAMAMDTPTVTATATATATATVLHLHIVGVENREERDPARNPGLFSGDGLLLAG